jgi:hypothetical protein
MAKSVFIFGAGASFSTGTPLMGNFYDAIASLTPSLNEEDQNHFNKIRDLKRNLSSLYANFKMDPLLNNIETLYGLIEMGSLIEYLDGYETKDIVLLKYSINRFIVRTIEKSTAFYSSQTKGISTNSDYNNLFSRIFSQNSLNEFIREANSVCFITFNYDIALDFELEKLARDTNFTLSYFQPQATRQNIKLLKLHGSINWGKCDSGHITPISILKDNQALNTIMRVSDSKQFLEISKFVKGRECSIRECKNKTQDLPLIVPPTWNKTEYHKQLAIVWKQAAKEISEAEKLFIIGYSLPESDIFFKYLMMLGAFHFPNIKELNVVNNNEDAIKRFSNMMGDEIKPKFHAHQKTFDVFINDYFPHNYKFGWL